MKFFSYVKVSIITALLFSLESADARRLATALTDSNFKTACSEWVADSDAATIEYGAIADWDTSAITDMSDAFNGASSFNGDIGGWDTSAVVSMGAMFVNCAAFNQNLATWQTGEVTNMYALFYGANAFNGDIAAWTTSKVTTMGSMFREATVFNKDISSWDTSSVISMSNMFRDAGVFNEDISTWETSQVNTMAHMFRDAKWFDHDLSDWNIDDVATFESFCQGATAFTQTLCWEVEGSAVVTDMFTDSSGILGDGTGDCDDASAAPSSAPLDDSATASSVGSTQQRIMRLFCIVALLPLLFGSYYD
jgi:surface protein